MKRKVIGIIIIIIGCYLLFINTIFMLFQPVYIGYVVPVDPITYWTEWLMIYGWYTIPLAVAGFFLILIGRRYLIKKQE